MFHDLRFFIRRARVNGRRISPWRVGHRLFDFFRYQLDPADPFYQYARPGCLYTS